MGSKPSIRLNHAGFHVFDIERMVDFFTSVYGLHVTDRGIAGETGEIVFLCADPRDHHQLVLYEGRTSREGVHYNHMSFEVNDLDRLREIHRALQDYPGVTGIHTMNHGVSWAVYCHDPEGNRTEAFVDTPWYVNQPYYADNLDLSLSDEEIAETTRRMLDTEPTAEPVERWRARFAEKLGLDPALDPPREPSAQGRRAPR